MDHKSREKVFPKKWLLLAAAIVAEVIGTLSLRATVDDPAWLVVVVISYITAFTCLGLTLRTGVPIGVLYAIWGAVGVAVVAVLGVVLFGETLSLLESIGIAVIIAGVILVETGSHKAASSQEAEVTP